MFGGLGRGSRRGILGKLAGGDGTLNKFAGCHRKFRWMPEQNLDASRVPEKCLKRLRFLKSWPNTGYWRGAKLLYRFCSHVSSKIRWIL
jgi:hypothetical protein